MKFLDPLATLKLMGGAISIHISMALFSFYTYYYNYKSISDCSHLKPALDDGEPLKISTYYDVKLMMIAHFVCIFLDLLKRCYGSNDNSEKNSGSCNTYKKSTIMLLGIVTYMASILILQFEIFNPNVRDADIEDFGQPSTD
jgi:hypothetical protein